MSLYASSFYTMHSDILPAPSEHWMSSSTDCSPCFSYSQWSVSRCQSQACLQFSRADLRSKTARSSCDYWMSRFIPRLINACALPAVVVVHSMLASLHLQAIRLRATQLLYDAYSTPISCWPLLSTGLTMSLTQECSPCFSYSL